MNRSPLDMKEIECPVCFELMKPPIYMCENGHGMCDNCKPKLTNCPVCNGKLTTERKHYAEMLSRSVKHHCKFQTSGCTELYFLNEKEEHEELCLYRHRECPLGREKCAQEVDPAVAEDHILEDHADLIIHRPLNIYSVILWSSLREVNRVLVKEDDMFIVNVRLPKQRDKSDMIVSCTYVGSPDDPRKYKYKLTLYCQKSYGMLSYTKICLSYLELLERGMTADTCIILPHAVYKEFLGGENDSLAYEIGIDTI